ncbi:bifunctional preprotein translocase subunit SecD/SecF [Polystyrenella longa]|uniref:Bifunctional preprotein translocase subunit SecD/SecF n=1 Tax=Polystyrenella longa TaxID=2528007 RepID=A0A518CSB8_9PLAN|nr:MMPL family transporter [Polystyrenella longa]QDU82122.1 bifunctional preprotein translocase subunit SecD/SecF [Polystyrenella longa]
MSASSEQPSHSSSSLDGLVHLLIRLRWILLLTGIALIIIFWPVANRISFDQSIESMYANDNVHLADYVQSRKFFGGDEFVILVNQNPDLFDNQDELELNEKSIDEIHTLVEQLTGVRPDEEYETSESDAPSIDRPEGVQGVETDSVQNLATTLDFKHTRKRITNLIEGILIGEDRQTNAVVMRLVPEQEAIVPRSETIREIKEIAEQQSRKTYVVGEPVQIQEMFNYVEEDGRNLFYASLGLLGVVLLCFFRSLRWVLLPITMCLFSIKGTEAILVMSEAQLSMVSSMLNSLVMIIGIATITHIAVHYLSARNLLSPSDALSETMQKLLPAIAWTCATTAVGFGALLSSQIRPVQSFGIMMALASLMVLVSVLLFVPGGVLWRSGKVTRLDSPDSNAPNSHLGNLLYHQAMLLERHPKRVVGGFLGLLVLAGIGFTQLRVETDFSRNFRESSPIVQSLNFVESHLGGAGNWEVNFPAPDELNEAFLERVEKVSDQLRELRVDEETYLTKVISLADGVNTIPRIPIVASSLRKRMALLNGFQKNFVDSLYNVDEQRMRIVLRAQERQPSEQKLALIHSAQQIVAKEFGEAKTTGLYVLLAYLIDSLLSDQLISFLFAGLGIFLMMSLAFRSLLIGLISIVPNLFPIIVVIGFMGWFGVPINIATAMIASVSLGLTVDSSIHYLASFRRERESGATFEEAIHRTHQATGKALVYANLALIAGFSVLTLSHFIPLIYFGILVSLAMLGGLAGNLFLLPVLLKAIERFQTNAKRLTTS